MSLDRSKLCHKLKVANRIQETEDTISLVLEIPNELQSKFKYRAGQFVTFFLDITQNGKTEEVRRSYSLASSPDYDTNFKISVKLVPGGRGSTFLTKEVKVGQELWTTPPAGLFCLPQFSSPTQITAKKIAFYAAGSGITPIISLLKTTLKTTGLSCVLYYQSQTEKNIIFKDELQKLANEFKSRLEVHQILSQPEGHWSGVTGRTTKNHIRDFLVKAVVGIQSLHYICGPDGFMQTVAEALKDFGLDKSKIHIESFASTVSHTDNAPHATAGVAEKDNLPNFEGDEVWIGKKEQRGAPKTIEALIDGVTHNVPAKEGSTILETLLEAGLNPPYSCMDGACMACMAKLEEGLAYQNDLGILSDENVEVGECLTCQARPASGKVKINYGAL